MTRLSWFVARRSWIVCVLISQVALEGLAFGESRTTNPERQGRIGVLVIAHGGTNRWDGMVRAAVRQAEVEFPTEVALGMGMHRSEVRVLQQAVDRLERKGVSRIVVVPFFISSHSEVFRQFEYLFGLRPEPEWAEAGGPLNLEVPVVMGEALDDSPVVAEILLERARSLSRKPEEETVVLVAHGPIGDTDNQRWLSTMRRLAASIKQEGGFRTVASLTMRDDAPKPVQEAAAQQLRDIVQWYSQQGRALVLPLLIAQGGVERKIPKILAGLTYVYKGETLLPHPKLVEWIAQQATQLASVPDGSEAVRHASGRASFPTVQLRSARLSAVVE